MTTEQTAAANSLQTYLPPICQGKKQIEKRTSELIRISVIDLKEPNLLKIKFSVLKIKSLENKCIE